MAETTWLQCTMPKPDWEKLNERRLKLGLKWSQFLPSAAEFALDHLEAHPSEVAELIGAKKAQPQPKLEAKPKAVKAQSKKAKKEKVPNLPSVSLSVPLTSEDIAELADIK